MAKVAIAVTIRRRRGGDYFHRAPFLRLPVAHDAATGSQAIPVEAGIGGPTVIPFRANNSATSANATLPCLFSASEAPEQELIVHGVRAWMDAEAPDALQALLARPINWTLLLRLARRHKVSSLLASVLCGRWGAACPSEVIADLRATTRVIAIASLNSASVLGQVVGQLQTAQVEVIAYKGALLSDRVYKNLGLRDFGDLDMLVRDWEYYHSVGNLLAREGWVQIADYGFERGYLHRGAQAVLDVHRTFTFPLQMPFRLDFARVLERSVDWEVMGTAVRTLALPDLLIVLCVQLAKDAGDASRGLPLIKLCDIAQLVRSHSELDWDLTLREARRLGVLHIVCLGMAVAADLLRCPIPEEIKRLSMDVPALSALVRHVEERILNGPGVRYSHPELVDPLTWNAAVRERFRDRNRSMIYVRESVLSLDERDYSFVRLPRRLNSLYRLVKPVRLAWKAGRRLVGRPIA